MGYHTSQKYFSQAHFEVFKEYLGENKRMSNSDTLPVNPIFELNAFYSRIMFRVVGHHHHTACYSSTSNE